MPAGDFRNLGKPKRTVKRKRRGKAAAAAACAAALIAVPLLVSAVRNAEYRKITYKELRTYMSQGRIDSAEFSPSADTLTGTLSDGSHFRAENPEKDGFKEELLLSGADVKRPAAVDPEAAVTVITALAMMGFFWAVFGKYYAGTGGSGMKTKLYTSEDLPGITFADVAGNEEAKENLRDVAEFLHDPAAFRTYGAKCPKGVLMTGQPGVGKTLLARALAGEAGVPFIAVSGSEFTEKFVGVGAARVRELFRTAREKAPCILFIDEIDAVGRARSADGSSNDEKDNTLNQLLVELDGFDGTENIVVIGATNRPDIMDQAFRSGRFDRQIQLLPPDREARTAIFKVHTKDKPLAPGTDTDRIGRLTAGMTGADIGNAVNEAAISAAKNRRPDGITEEDFEAGIDKVLLGDERKSRPAKGSAERSITAWHEAGHALVSVLLGMPVSKASIVPTTKGAGGYTVTERGDGYMLSENDYRNAVIAAYAGRAAEEARAETYGLGKGAVTSGCVSDTAKATEIIRLCVFRYSMFGGEQPSHLSADPDSGSLPEIQAAKEKRAAEISDALYAEAVRILKEHRGALAETAALLEEKETLYGDEIAAAAENGAAAPENPHAV